MLILTPEWEPCGIELVTRCLSVFCPGDYVTYRVGTGEADGRGGLGARAADNVELGALHVELRSRVVAGAVQGDHLGTKKVLSRGDARRDADIVAALAVDDRLGTPDTIAEAVLLDLEPAATNTGIACGIVDLLEIGQGRSLCGSG